VTMEALTEATQARRLKILGDTDVKHAVYLSVDHQSTSRSLFHLEQRTVQL
jgi:hypothetical protein